MEKIGMRDVLIFFYVKHKGDWDKVYNSLQNKDAMLPGQLNHVKIICEENKINFMTIMDMDYPYELKNVWKPPFVYEVKDEAYAIYDTKNDDGDKVKSVLINTRKDLFELFDKVDFKTRERMH